MDNESRTTAVGLARYAQEYFEAGLAADKTIGACPSYEIHAPSPVMFLLPHSLELILKSFLRHKDCSLKKLRGLSHGIYGCYDYAKSLGLSDYVVLDKSEERLLQLISELHQSTELRYIKTGSKMLPVFGPMKALTEKFLEGIYPVVGYQKFVSNK